MSSEQLSLIDASFQAVMLCASGQESTRRAFPGRVPAEAGIYKHYKKGDLKCI